MKPDLERNLFIFLFLGMSFFILIYNLVYSDGSNKPEGYSKESFQRGYEQGASDIKDAELFLKYKQYWDENHCTFTKTFHENGNTFVINMEVDKNDWDCEKMKYPFNYENNSLTLNETDINNARR